MRPRTLATHSSSLGLTADFPGARNFTSKCGPDEKESRRALGFKGFLPGRARNTTGSGSAHTDTHVHTHTDGPLIVDVFKCSRGYFFCWLLILLFRFFASRAPALPRLNERELFHWRYFWSVARTRED